MDRNFRECIGPENNLAEDEYEYLNQIFMNQSPTFISDLLSDSTFVARLKKNYSAYWHKLIETEIHNNDCSLFRKEMETDKENSNSKRLIVENVEKLQKVFYLAPFEINDAVKHCLLYFSCKRDTDYTSAIQNSDLLDVYAHLRGENWAKIIKEDEHEELHKKTINYINLKIEHTILNKEVKLGTFLNLNNLIIWGDYLKFENTRSIDLFTQPSMGYLLSNGKNALVYLLKKVTEKQLLEEHKFKYVCQMCHITFYSLRWFAAHLNRKTTVFTYMCRSCGFLKFNNPCALIYHILIDRVENTKGKKQHYCPGCESFVPRLNEHLLRKFANKPIYNCFMCNYNASNQCSLALHKLNHNKKLPYICPNCGEYFIYEVNYNQHVKQLCLSKCRQIFVKCSLCLVLFSEKYLLYNHIFANHYSRELLCKDCTDRFLCHSDLSEHMKVSHSKSSLQHHIRNFCALCPNLSFRGNRKIHILSHCDDKQYEIVVFKCHCNYHTDDEEKMLCHRRQLCDVQQKLKRPHIIKVCSSCSEYKAYNNTMPFICEPCQGDTDSVYKCMICEGHFDFNWDLILDHFFIFHSREDLQTCHEKVSIVKGGNEHVCKSYSNGSIHFMNGSAIIHPTIKATGMSQKKCQILQSKVEKKLAVTKPPSTNFTELSTVYSNGLETLKGQNKFKRPTTSPIQNQGKEQKLISVPSTAGPSYSSSLVNIMPSTSTDKTQKAGSIRIRTPQTINEIILSNQSYFS